MPTARTVQPTRPGLLVRRPNGTLLPPEGDTVVWSSYWARRLRDGDIRVVEAQASKGESKGRKTPPPAATITAAPASTKE